MNSKASLEDHRRAAVCERLLAEPAALADAPPSPVRVRPGDPAWPSEVSWDQLDRDVGGRLIKVRSPLADCVGASSDAGLRASVQGTQESLLPRRRGRADPVARLGRGLDVAAERLRGRRQDDGRRRRRGQFRADEQSAARGQRRRPQLPGDIERRRLPADLDAPHERGRRCTTPLSARAARAARSRSRPSRSKPARSGATSTTR